MKYTAIRQAVAKQLGWQRRKVRQKSAAWQRTIAAGGIFLSMAAGASGQTVPDASFEDHNIVTHNLASGGTVDYSYSADGGGWVDGYSPEAGGDSAWTSRESSGRGAWIYNTAYAAASNRSIPRTGDQAISGAGGYTYQVLSDTFEPNTEYTFNIYAAQPVGTGRFFLYIYDGTLVTDGGDDDDNLNFSEINFDHGGNLDPTDWVEYSVKYTTASVSTELGNQIGLSFWTSGNVYLDDISLDAGLPSRLALLFDRDTGEISLVNNTGSPQSIAGYSILSADGALIESNWTSIDDNYDGSGDMSVGSEEWNEFTASGSSGDLSEGVLGTGTIADGASISLGVGAWLQYYQETDDLTFEYLDANGNLITDGSIAFSGTTQTTPFSLGDLNFDGTVDGQDWLAYAAGLGTDMTGMSDAQSYRNGDLTGDQVNNHADFLAFQSAYDTANGSGAFTAMVANVPEPSSVVIAMLGLVSVLGPAWRCRVS